MLNKLHSSGLIGLFLLVLANIAFAHPGHGLESAFSAFTHPLTGLDHLLVMLAIGIVAAKIGGKLRWQLPLTFVFFMAIGVALSANGFYFTGVESGVAVSMMALGFVLSSGYTFSTLTRFSMTAIIAIFHGMTHGFELNLQGGLMPVICVLLATVLLHATGVGIASIRFKVMNWLQQVLGLCMLLLGASALIH